MPIRVAGVNDEKPAHPAKGSWTCGRHRMHARMRACDGRWLIERRTGRGCRSRPWTASEPVSTNVRNHRRSRRTSAPISGGTLIALQDGNTAVAADPDRDAVYVVDQSTAAVTHTVALQTGDEPGRLVEDGAGRVHVVLRGGGALATIDPGTGALVARRNVCPAPRGLAWYASRDLV